MTTDALRVRTVVIGAGFAGLAVARAMDRAGERDFLVLERRPDVGGTWRDNTYPGAACDVPSQLYSYSFALHRDWSRTYATQPEIQAYLQRVARESGVLDRVLLDTTVVGARWDDAALRWRVEARGPGGPLAVDADVLVSAAGALSDPRTPDLEGIDRFRGRVFHTARWDHTVDLTGTRVAVLGTGASAVQVVPELAGRTAHLDVFQRTAPWVVARRDRPWSAGWRRALRWVPGLRRLHRLAVYCSREVYVPVFTRWPGLARPAERAVLRTIEAQVRDPALRAAVTPRFGFGCKRVLLSDDWYRTLDRDDVDLVTAPVSHLTEDALVTADGRVHPVDTLVLATGFQATELPIAHVITGRAGTTLAAHWAEHGAQAYKGTTVAGWPNLFLLVGPNTGLGHSSMLLMIEAQVRYVLDALRHLRRLGGDGQDGQDGGAGRVALEPRPEAQAAWVADVQRRLARSVWNTGGCASWYLDRHGRNVTLWPRTTVTFRRLLARFDPEAYTVVVPDQERVPT